MWVGLDRTETKSNAQITFVLPATRPTVLEGELLSVPVLPVFICSVLVLPHIAFSNKLHLLCLFHFIAAPAPLIIS